MEHLAIDTVTTEVLRDAGCEQCVRVPIRCVVETVLGVGALRFAARASLPRGACGCVEIDEHDRHIIRIARHMETCFARWVAAHELGHVVLRHRQYGDAQAEREADYFAASLLMPSWAVRRVVCDRGLDLGALATIFVVPQTAVALRVGEVDAVAAAIVVTTYDVRVRSARGMCLPSASQLRAIARVPAHTLAKHRPGITKVRITDARNRIFLGVGEAL